MRTYLLLVTTVLIGCRHVIKLVTAARGYSEAAKIPWQYLACAHFEKTALQDIWPLKSLFILGYLGAIHLQASLEAEANSTGQRPIYWPGADWEASSEAD